MGSVKLFPCSLQLPDSTFPLSVLVLSYLLSSTSLFPYLSRVDAIPLYLSFCFGAFFHRMSDVERYSIFLATGHILFHSITLALSGNPFHPCIGSVFFNFFF
ncbi:hypothetical protein E1B28_007988 [Marasmius oreades]|uniref:Uncharacterized protein n=1 Tax=Marasmius oreades TaxID=181124 RepID=A0A9P7S3A5_9AGAR|nr:uncharacterized protein E1B28_007988 [Marasmius oreades]KAG7094388.1 hypothetical protein E1B28_007988 [Marasmius oreades]